MDGSFCRFRTRSFIINLIIEFFINAGVALLITLIVILAAAIYIFVYRKKSFSEWRAKEGKGSAASAGLGVGLIMLIAFIISVVGAILIIHAYLAKIATAMTGLV